LTELAAKLYKFFLDVAGHFLQLFSHIFAC
jgi:hypothetical protein